MPQHSEACCSARDGEVVDDSTLQQRSIRLGKLPDHFKVEIVEAAERTQVGRDETSREEARKL